MLSGDKGDHDVGAGDVHLDMMADIAGGDEMQVQRNDKSYAKDDYMREG